MSPPKNQQVTLRVGLDPIDLRFFGLALALAHEPADSIVSLRWSGVLMDSESDAMPTSTVRGQGHGCVGAGGGALGGGGVGVVWGPQLP